MSDKPENAKPAWAGGAYQSEITAVNVTVSRLTVKQNSKLLFVHSVVDDAQLDIESFRVFAHIVRRANGSGIAFPSVKSAAKVCKLNKDTAHEIRHERGLKTLQYLCTAENVGDFSWQ
jgi:hypothetical protein